VLYVWAVRRLWLVLLCWGRLGRLRWLLGSGLLGGRCRGCRGRLLRRMLWWGCRCGVLGVLLYMDAGYTWISKSFYVMGDEDEDR
jgi:hypothetical protein